MPIIMVAIFLLVGVSYPTHVSAQQLNLKRKCSAEAFNGDFLIELVSIPTDISKKYNFSAKQTIRGFRANILCTGRYSFTKVDVLSFSKKNLLKQNIIITDENYGIISKFPIQANSQKDITKQVCNKVIYIIPGYYRDNKLTGYNVIEKDYSSNIINNRCIYNNRASVKEGKSQTETTLQISRILPKISNQYQKHY